MSTVLDFLQKAGSFSKIIHLSHVSASLRSVLCRSSHTLHDWQNVSKAVLREEKEVFISSSAPCLERDQFLHLINSAEIFICRSGLIPLWRPCNICLCTFLGRDMSSSAYSYKFFPSCRVP